jgi:hypothetical protein
MFSLSDPDAIGAGSPVDAMTLMNPALQPFILPSGVYGELTPHPIVTVAVDKILVTTTETDEPTIYDLANHIERLRPALTALNPAAFRASDHSTNQYTYMFHPGAQAFRARDEPNLLERYSGVAEVTITLLIGVISGMYAVAQIYGRRRKNRIDRFYAEVLALRKYGLSASDNETREQTIRDLMSLEEQAFERLINEEIAADDSFRIFTELNKEAIEDVRNRLDA